MTQNIRLPIRNYENEEVNVYIKSNEQLIIWAVGGVDNLNYAISSVIEATKVLEKENAYKKLVILMDRDQTISEAQRQKP